MELLDHQKYNQPPPEGHLCERCNVNPCGINELGRIGKVGFSLRKPKKRLTALLTDERMSNAPTFPQMWICTPCANKDFKQPQLVNKARGTSAKIRHRKE